MQISSSITEPRIVMCKSSICSHKAVHKPSQDCPSTSKCLSIALTSLRRLSVHGLSSPAFAMHHIPLDCLVVVHMPFDPTATVPKVNHRTGCHDKVTTRRPGRRGRSLKRFRAPGDMDVWSILLSMDSYKVAHRPANTITGSSSSLDRCQSCLFDILVNQLQ